MSKSTTRDASAEVFRSETSQQSPFQVEEQKAWSGREEQSAGCDGHEAQHARATSSLSFFAARVSELMEQQKLQAATMEEERKKREVLEEALKQEIMRHNELEKSLLEANSVINSLNKRMDKVLLPYQTESKNWEDERKKLVDTKFPGGFRDEYFRNQALILEHQRRLIDAQICFMKHQELICRIVEDLKEEKNLLCKVVTEKASTVEQHLLHEATICDSKHSKAEPHTDDQEQLNSQHMDSIESLAFSEMTDVDEPHSSFSENTGRAQIRPLQPVENRATIAEPKFQPMSDGCRCARPASCPLSLPVEDPKPRHSSSTNPTTKTTRRKKQRFSFRPLSSLRLALQG
jgi:flagellar motility protein MotE (MotC chaperone)